MILVAGSGAVHEIHIPGGMAEVYKPIILGSVRDKKQLKNYSKKTKISRQQ